MVCESQIINIAILDILRLLEKGPLDEYSKRRSTLKVTRRIGSARIAEKQTLEFDYR